MCDPPSAPAGSIETMLMLAGWSPVHVQNIMVVTLGKKESNTNRLMGLLFKFLMSQLLFALFFFVSNKINILVVTIGKKEKQYEQTDRIVL